jgi:hypothetical protein
MTDRAGENRAHPSTGATIDDVYTELVRLRNDLAADRTERRKNQRRGAKRARTVALRAVAGVQPTELQVRKAKRIIRERNRL